MSAPDAEECPLVRRLQDARWFDRASLLTSVQRAPLHASSALYGTRRGLARPNVALQTLVRMGPVRHALAQRAICGIIEVHAPFSPAPKK